MIRRDIPYTAIMSISSFITAVLLVLLRMIPDVESAKGSIAINLIIIILLTLAVGLGLGTLAEKYWTDGDLR